MTKDGLVTKEITRQKAIRAKCLECCNWQPGEVRNCNIPDCALYPYRGTTNKNDEIVTAIVNDGEYFKDLRNNQ